MAKDINLNSSEWCDIVFEGKNQDYGACNMRQTSPKRHARAFIISFLFIAFIAILPTLIEKVKSLQPKQKNTEVNVLSNLKIQEEVKEENIKHETEAPPPPKLKNTVQFSQAVITEDDKVRDDEEMKSQEDLKTSNATISVATVKGSNDADAIDIADLKEHKVIVEEHPLITAEQMPVFPGGEEELFKYIHDHLNYPAIAAETGVEGRVTVRFVVGKTGDVSDVEVIRGFDASCEKEAVRVIKSMPKWIPGQQNGRAVPVFFTVPIVFKLQK